MKDISLYWTSDSTSSCLFLHPNTSHVELTAAVQGAVRPVHDGYVYVQTSIGLSS